MEKLSDRELYLRCCQGDEEAWRYLYGYVRSIARWGRWDLGEAAEDLAQAVVLHLMERGLAMVRSADAFRRFVLRTTINRVLDYYRSGEVRFRYRPRPHEEERPEAADPVVSHPDRSQAVESRTAARLDLERWQGLMDRLPAYCRAVLEAYMEYKLGLLASYREIAQRVGRPLNTISVQIKRCLEMVRQAAGRAGLLEPSP